MSMPMLPDETQCRYPSKPCRNQRAKKANGELHRFCQYHRRKANLNQQRWSRCRRRQGPAVPASNNLTCSSFTSPSPNAIKSQTIRMLSLGRQGAAPYDQQSALSCSVQLHAPTFHSPVQDHQQHQTTTAMTIPLSPLVLQAEDIQTLQDLFLQDRRVVPI